MATKPSALRTPPKSPSSRAAAAGGAEASASPVVTAPARQTKLQNAVEGLELLAVGLGSGAKLPTVPALCERFGVSLTTLTTALTQLEGRGVIRRRHGIGLFVDEGLRSRNIVLLCDAEFFARPGLSPFWNLLLDKVRERARTEALGFEVHFAETHLRSQTGESGGSGGASVISPTVAGLIESGRVDGVIAVGVHWQTTYWLEQRNVPIVVFGGPGTYSVSIDMADLVRKGVDALADDGMTRIGLWSSYSPKGDRGERDAGTLDPRPLKAFQEAIAQRGLAFDPALIQDGRPESAVVFLPPSVAILPQEQGYQAALTVYGGPAESDGKRLWPEAIVSTNDMFTSGVLLGLRRLGLRLGYDLHVATHANAGSPALLGYEEEVIRLEVEPADVVAALFAKLEALMDGSGLVTLRTEIRSRVISPAR